MNFLSATGTDFFWAGLGGTANNLDLTGGDIYVQDDLEVDGTIFGDVTGALTGNAVTATALAVNPAACTNQFVRDLDADGTLTCETVDVSSDSNLAVSSPITQTGDTIGFDYSTHNEWTGYNDFAAGLFADNASSTNATTSKMVISSFLTIDSEEFDSLTDDPTLANNGGQLQCVDVTCTNCLNATEIEDIYLLLAGDSSSNAYTWTGAHDFGGGVIEMTNGTGPTVNAIGEFAFDTSDNQFLIATSTEDAWPAVYPTTQRLWAATIASTSVDFISGGSILMYANRDAVRIKEIHCSVESGTSVVINVSSDSGSSDTESVTCDGNGASDIDITTNNAIGASATTTLEIGTITGTVDYLEFSVW